MGAKKAQDYCTEDAHGPTHMVSCVQCQETAWLPSASCLPQAEIGSAVFLVPTDEVCKGNAQEYCAIAHKCVLLT